DRPRAESPSEHHFRLRRATGLLHTKIDIAANIRRSRHGTASDGRLVRFRWIGGQGEAMPLVAVVAGRRLTGTARRTRARVAVVRKLAAGCLPTRVAPATPSARGCPPGRPVRVRGTER